MSRPIGYYIHHHGDGHRQRAIVIAHQAPDRFVLIGTGLKGRTDGLPCLDLPDDRPSGDREFAGIDNCEQRPSSLHYAPIGNHGVRRRVAQLAAWISRARPLLLVVDVSVEIAMLARLSSTPTVYVRLAGARTDPAHLDAFRGARALLAPFHEDLDNPETTGWVRDKTHYAPGLTTRPVSKASLEKVVLAVFGGGGAAGDGDLLAESARATPNLQWRAVGNASQPKNAPANLVVLGWVENVQDEISAAGVVVGGAGDGLVSAVLAAGRPFVCIPEARPFNEQVSKAGRLAALGRAVVIPGWPAASDWPQLLAEAQELRRVTIDHLHDSNGPQKAARFLSSIADSSVFSK